MPAIHPCLYLLLLSAAVGLGLPAGALVVGAGAMFGPGLGLLTVLLAEAIGLLLNWRLCRGLLRPKMERWLARTPKARRLEQLIGQPAGLKLLLLLRLALIPMNLVNAGCALGPTRLQPYALASLALIPRFALMVLAGATGAESMRGNLSPLSLTARWVAVAASAAVLCSWPGGCSSALPGTAQKPAIRKNASPRQGVARSAKPFPPFGGYTQQTKYTMVRAHMQQAAAP